MGMFTLAGHRARRINEEGEEVLAPRKFFLKVTQPCSWRGSWQIGYDAESIGEKTWCRPKPRF